MDKSSGSPQCTHTQHKLEEEECVQQKQSSTVQPFINIQENQTNNEKLTAKEHIGAVSGNLPDNKSKVGTGNIDVDLTSDYESNFSTDCEKSSVNNDVKCTELERSCIGLKLDGDSFDSEGLHGSSCNINVGVLLLNKGDVAKKSLSTTADNINESIRAGDKVNNDKDKLYVDDVNDIIPLDSDVNDTTHNAKIFDITNDLSGASDIFDDDSDAKTDDYFDELDEDFDDNFTGNSCDDENCDDDCDELSLSFDFSDIEKVLDGSPGVTVANAEGLPVDAVSADSTNKDKDSNVTKPDIEISNNNRNKPLTSQKVAFSDNITVHKVSTSDDVPKGPVTLAQSEDLYDSELEEGSITLSDYLFNIEFDAEENNSTGAKTELLFPYNDNPDIFEKSGNNLQEWIHKYETESDNLQCDALQRRLDGDPVLVADIVAHRLSSTRSFSHCSDESVNSDGDNDDVFHDNDQFDQLDSNLASKLLVPIGIDILPGSSKKPDNNKHIEIDILPWSSKKPDNKKHIEIDILPWSSKKPDNNKHIEIDILPWSSKKPDNNKQIESDILPGSSKKPDNNKHIEIDILPGSSKKPDNNKQIESDILPGSSKKPDNNKHIEIDILPGSSKKPDNNKPTSFLSSGDANEIRSSYLSTNSGSSETNKVLLSCINSGSEENIVNRLKTEECIKTKQSNNSNHNLETIYNKTCSFDYLYKEGGDKEAIEASNQQKLQKNSLATEIEYVKDISNIKNGDYNPGTTAIEPIQTYSSQQHTLSTQYIDSSILQSAILQGKNIHSKLDTQIKEDNITTVDVKDNLSGSSDPDSSSDDKKILSTTCASVDVCNIHDYNSKKVYELKEESSSLGDIHSKSPPPRQVIAGDSVHLRNQNAKLKEQLSKHNKVEVSNNEKVVLSTAPCESDVSRIIPVKLAGGGSNNNTRCDKTSLQSFKLSYISMEQQHQQQQQQQQNKDGCGSEKADDATAEYIQCVEDSYKKESTEEYSANEDFEVIDFNINSERDKNDSLFIDKPISISMESSGNSSNDFEIVDLDGEPRRRLHNKYSNSTSPIYHNQDIDPGEAANITMSDPSNFVGEEYTERNTCITDDDIINQENVRRVTGENIHTGITDVKGEYLPEEQHLSNINVDEQSSGEIDLGSGTEDTWVDITKSTVLQSESGNAGYNYNIQSLAMDEIKAESLQRIQMAEVESLNDDDDDLGEEDQIEMDESEIEPQSQTDEFSSFKSDIAMAKELVSQIYGSKIELETSKTCDEGLIQPDDEINIVNQALNTDVGDTTDDEIANIMASSTSKNDNKIRAPSYKPEKESSSGKDKKESRDVINTVSKIADNGHDKVDEAADGHSNDDDNTNDMYGRGRSRHRRTVKEVKEAVKKLRGEGIPAKERPHSYHGGDHTDPGAEVRSRSGSQRRYDWNTTHFFPDIHEAGTGYHRRGSGTSNLSDYLDENWLQDIQSYCIDTETTDNIGPTQAETLGKTRTIPITIVHDTVMDATHISRSDGEKENLPPPQNHDDGDYASSSDGDRDGPQMWSKSPLHHNKKKRKDRMNGASPPHEMNGVHVEGVTPLDVKEPPLGAIPISRTGLKLGSPGIQRGNRRKTTPNMGTKVTPRKYEKQSSEDIQDKYDKFAELQRRRKALESTSDESINAMKYNSIQDSLRRYEKHKHPMQDSKAKAQRKLFQSEQTVTEETSSSAYNYQHKVFTEQKVSMSSSSGQKQMLPHVDNLSNDTRPPPLPQQPPPAVTPPPVRHERAASQGNRDDLTRGRASRSPSKEFNRSSSSRSRGSKDEGTNDFLIQMKKRLKSVQHKSQEDVRYEQKPTAVDRKKVKSEIFFDQTVPGLNNGVNMTPYKSQPPPKTEPLSTHKPKQEVSRNQQKVDLDTHSQHDEVFVDDVFMSDAAGGRYANKQQRSMSAESQQNSQASDGSTSKRFDAKSLVLEERKKFEEYKREYVRRMSSKESTSGDDLARDSSGSDLLSSPISHMYKPNDNINPPSTSNNRTNKKAQPATASLAQSNTHVITIKASATTTTNSFPITNETDTMKANLAIHPDHAINVTVIPTANLSSNTFSSTLPLHTIANVKSASTAAITRESCEEDNRPHIPPDEYEYILRKIHHTQPPPLHDTSNKHDTHSSVKEATLVSEKKTRTEKRSQGEYEGSYWLESDSYLEKQKQKLLDKQTKQPTGLNTSEISPTEKYMHVARQFSFNEEENNRGVLHSRSMSSLEANVSRGNSNERELNEQHSTVLHDQTRDAYRKRERGHSNSNRYDPQRQSWGYFDNQDKDYGYTTAMISTNNDRQELDNLYNSNTTNMQDNQNIYHEKTHRDSKLSKNMIDNNGQGRIPDFRDRKDLLKSWSETHISLPTDNSVKNGLTGHEQFDHRPEQYQARAVDKLADYQGTQHSGWDYDNANRMDPHAAQQQRLDYADHVSQSKDKNNYNNYGDYGSKDRNNIPGYNNVYYDTRDNIPHGYLDQHYNSKYNDPYYDDGKDKGYNVASSRPPYVNVDYSQMKPPVPKPEAVPKEPKYWQANSLYQSSSPPQLSPHSSTYSAPVYGQQPWNGRQHQHSEIHNPYYRSTEKPVPPYGSVDNVQQAPPGKDQYNYRDEFHQTPKQHANYEQYLMYSSSHSLDHGKSKHQHNDGASHDSSFDQGSERVFQLEITPKKPPRTYEADKKLRNQATDRDKYIREYVPSKEEQSRYFQPIDVEKLKQPYTSEFPASSNNYSSSMSRQPDNKTTPYGSSIQPPSYTQAYGTSEHASNYQHTKPDQYYTSANQQPQYTSPSQQSQYSTAYQPTQYNPVRQHQQDSSNQYPGYLMSSNENPQYSSSSQYQQPLRANDQYSSYKTASTDPEQYPTTNHNKLNNQYYNPQYPTPMQSQFNAKDAYQPAAVENPAYSQVPISQTDAYPTNREPIRSGDTFQAPVEKETYTQVFPPPPPPMNDENDVFEFSPREQQQFSREVNQKLHVLGETDARFRDYEEKVTKYIQEQKKRSGRNQVEMADMVPRNMLDHSQASNQYEAHIKQGLHKYRANATGDEEEDYVDLKTIREQKEVFEDIRRRKQQRSRSLPRNPSTMDRDVSPRRYPPPLDQRNGRNREVKESSPHRHLPVVPDPSRQGAGDSATDPHHPNSRQQSESSIQRYYRTVLQNQQDDDDNGGFKPEKPILKKTSDSVLLPDGRPSVRECESSPNRPISLGSWKSGEEGKDEGDGGFERAAKQTQSFRHSPERKYSSKDFVSSSSTKPNRYDVKTEIQPSRYVLRPSRSAENIDKINEDVGNRSVKDIKERLFGPTQTQLKAPVSRNKQEVTSPQNSNVKVENVKAYFNPTDSVPSFAKVPVYGSSSSRNIRDQEQDELLYNYVSYRDTSNTKPLNIFDDLTDLELTYRKLNNDQEEKGYNAAPHDLTDGHDSIKRLSISNVRKFEEMLEMRQQQGQDWTKEWVSREKTPTTSNNKSDESMLQEKVTPERSAQSYSTHQQYHKDETGSTAATSDITRSFDGRLSLPRKKADDMAFRKTHQNQRPLTSVSMPAFNYSGGNSPNVTPSASLDNVQSGLRSLRSSQRHRSSSPDLISEELSRHGYQKTTLGGSELSRTDDNTGRRSRLKSTPDRNTPDKLQKASSSTTPLYTPKKTTTEVTLSIKKRSQSLDRSKVDANLGSSALQQRSRSIDRNDNVSTSNNKPVGKGIASMITIFSTSRELTASAPDLSAKAKDASVFSGNYNVDGDLVSNDPKFKHAVKPKKSFTPRELKMRNELRTKLKSGRSGDSGFQESDQSDSSDHHYHHHRLPPDGLCESDDMDLIKVSDESEKNNTSVNYSSKLHHKKRVISANANNNNSSCSSRSNSKTPPSPTIKTEMTVRLTPPALRKTVSQEDRLHLRDDYRDEEIIMESTSPTVHIGDISQVVTTTQKEAIPLQQSAVRPSHMDFNKMKRKQFFQDLSQRKLVGGSSPSSSNEQIIGRKSAGRSYNIKDDEPFATQFSQLKYIDDVIDSAVISKSPPAVGEVVNLPMGNSSDSSSSSSTPASDEQKSPATRKLSRDMLLTATDADQRSQKMIEVSLVKPKPYPFSLPGKKSSSSREEITEHKAQHSLEFSPKRLQAPPSDNLGSQLDLDLQVARQRLTAKLAPCVQSSHSQRDTPSQKKFKETNLDDLEPSIQQPSPMTTVISSHLPHVKSKDSPARYSWSDTKRSSSLHNIPFGNESTNVENYTEGFEDDSEGYRRQVNVEQTRVVKKRSQIQRELIYPSGEKDRKKISARSYGDVKDQPSHQRSLLFTRDAVPPSTADPSQELSDGEMTDATDITLDSMVRANIGSTPVRRDSPVTTDSSETTSENSQKEYIICHGVKRRPKSVRLVNPVSSKQQDQQSTGLFPQTISPSLSSHKQYSDFSNQQYQEVDMVHSPSSPPASSTKHQSSYYNTETSSSSRQISQSESSRESFEYKQEMNVQSDSFKREKKKDMRNDERRLSLKERVQLFEDQASPFLSKGPRVNKDLGDAV